MFPAMIVRYTMGWTEMLLIDVPIFIMATLSVFNFYLVCQREIYPDWKRHVKYLPLVLAIGIGLAVNNAKAVLEALVGHTSEFARTPKYGIKRTQDDWQHKKYHLSMHVQPFIEVALGLYFTGTVLYALANGIYGTVPFLVLFQFGFLYIGLSSLIQQFAGEGELAKAAQIAGK
jgi:hypothetical protein